MSDSLLSKLRLRRPHLAWPVVTLVCSLFIVAFDNRHFWQALVARIAPTQAADWIFIGVLAVIFVVLLNMVFTFFACRWTLKPLLTVLLLLAASVSYFTDNFGVIVDQSMIYNILETNTAEASELLTVRLLLHLMLFGGVPVLLLWLTRIRYFHWKRDILLMSMLLLGSLGLFAGLGFSHYKEIVLFGRENRDLRLFANPVQSIHALKKVVKTTYASPTDIPLQTIATDAQRDPHDPKEVVVMVLGETARSKSFALNGYEHETNPRLAGDDVINFSHVDSCGTSTAESIPCMFSLMEKDQYSRSEALHTENILDVLNRTGVEVLWRDNDSGDKGVATRVKYEDFSHQENVGLCAEDNCYDEILLQGLESTIQSVPGDTFVVLHTKGSHGPSYYKRTPPEFKLFQPECAQDNVQDCTQQQLINAYDNTIVYTDYILDSLIRMLKEQEFATAMLYVSDHGESLGENGIYLHGLPYALAPSEQTSVPLIFWASDTFSAQHHLDRAELSAVSRSDISHDYLFHSLLGLFDVKTKVYKPQLDLFLSRLHGGANSAQSSS